MNKSLKILLIILALIAGSLAAAATALALLIDPNIFRDDFQRLAARQGIVLTIAGELDWQFFPNIKIVTRDTRIAAPDSPEQPLASVDTLAVSVALMPLFNREVVVQGVTIDGLNADLQRDKTGRGNWQNLGPGAATSAASEPAAAPAAKDTNTSKDNNDMALAINKVVLQNAAIHYRDDATQTDLHLSNLNINGRDINLSGGAFPLSIATRLQLQSPEQILSGDIDVSGNLAYDNTASSAAISDGSIKFNLTQQAKNADHTSSNLTLNLDTRLNLALLLPAEKPFQLSSIHLQDGTLAWQSGTQQLHLNALSLDTALVPGGADQDLTFNANLDSKLGDTALQGPLGMQSRYRINADMTEVVLSEFAFIAKPNGQTLALKGDATVVTAPLSHRGHLKVDALNPRRLADLLGIALPAMANPKALSRSDLSTTFSGNDKQLNLSGLVLRLDATKVTGTASLSLVEDQAHKLDLQADVLNLDDYLPPQTDTATPKTDADKPSPNTHASTSTQANSGADAIDLSALQTLQLAAKVKIGQLLYRNIPLSSVNLDLNARSGNLALTSLSGTLYDSPFNSKARIDASATPYRFHIEGSGKQLPVGQLLKDLNMEQRVGGNSDLDLNLDARGNSISAIENSLDGNIVLKGQELQFDGINIERTFCRLVATVQKEEFKQEGWPAFTRFQDATTRITFNQGVAKLEKLNAGVSRLNLSGEGKINLRKAAFDLVFNTKLSGNAEGLGCVVNNDNILNRTIPIRCKAGFDNVGATTCLPDARVIEDIAKAKLKDKADEKVKEVLQEKLGTEGSDTAKQIFNQLFKKK